MAEKKKQRVKDLAWSRKQRQRERERTEKEVEDDDTHSTRNVNGALMEGARAMAESGTIPNVADISQPLTQDWTKSHNGKQRGAVKGKSEKVFWHHPFLWSLIEPAIRRNG